MKKVSRNYIYNLIYQIFTVVIPIFLTPYVSNVLGVVNVGIYGYVTSVVSLFTTIGLFGINTFGYREIAYYTDDDEKRNKIFFDIMKLRVVLFLVVLLIYLPFLFSDYSLFYVLMIFQIISMFFDVSWLFIGMEELKVVAIRNTLIKVLSTVFVFLLVKEPSDLWLYFLINSIFNFVVTLSIIPLLKKYISFKNFKFKTEWNQIWFYFKSSLKLFLPQIGLTLFLQISKIMLKMFKGEEFVAYYDYAEKIISIPLALITAMCTAFVPYLAKIYSKKNESEFQGAINKILHFSLLVALPLTFGIMGIADNFINWYLDASFQPIVITIYILAPTIILNSLLNVSGNQYFVVVNNTRILTISYFVALIIDILLNSFLIVLFDDCGAAIATNFGLLFAVILQFTVMRRNIKIQNILEIIKYFAAAIIMFVIIYIVGRRLEANILGTVIQVLIGMFIYFILVVVFRVKLISEFIELIKNKIKRN